MLLLGSLNLTEEEDFGRGLWTSWEAKWDLRPFK